MTTRAGDWDASWGDNAAGGRGSMASGASGTSGTSGDAQGAFGSSAAAAFDAPPAGSFEDATTPAAGDGGFSSFENFDDTPAVWIRNFAFYGPNLKVSLRRNESNSPFSNRFHLKCHCRGPCPNLTTTTFPKP